MSDESKKWTFISRILSGTGLWRLQNRIRAVGNAMKFYTDSQANKIRADIDEAEGLAKLQNALESKEKQEHVLNKLREKGAAYRADELKHDERAYKQAMTIIDQYNLMADAIGRTTHANKAHEIALEKTAAAYSFVGEQVEELRTKRVEKLQKTLDAEQFKKAGIRELLTGRKVKGEIAAIKEKRRQPFLENLTREGNVRRQRGLKEKLGELEQLEQARKQYLQDKLGFTLIKNMWTKLKGLPSGLWKLLKGFSIAGIKLFGSLLKYMVWVGLALMGLFLVFELVRKIVPDFEFLTETGEIIKGIFQGVSESIGGIMLIFKAFFGSGTFSERFQMLLDGIVGLFSGLGKIIWNAIGKIVVGTLFLLPLAIGEFIFSGIDKIRIALAALLVKAFVWFVGKFEGVKSWIMQSAPWKAIVWVRDKFRKAINNITTGLNYIPGVNIPKLATGGIISSKGMALVGERGPELVNLPKGAEVYSNADSRKMMGNTINVNVSGRVGASDSELRDIAKKIGRMVSAEINRTTSSSTNVRF
jgi:hypothetical protein